MLLGWNLSSIDGVSRGTPIYIIIHHILTCAFETVEDGPIYFEMAESRRYDKTNGWSTHGADPHHIYCGGVIFGCSIEKLSSARPELSANQIETIKEQWANTSTNKRCIISIIIRTAKKTLLGPTTKFFPTQRKRQQQIHTAISGTIAQSITAKAERLAIIHC